MPLCNTRTCTPVPLTPAPSSSPFRLGEFQAARAVVDAVQDRLSPSSQHAIDVRKKIREVDDVAAQLGALREQVWGGKGGQGR